jgi:hypothetical protein
MSESNDPLLPRQERFSRLRHLPFSFVSLSLIPLFGNLTTSEAIFPPVSLRGFLSLTYKKRDFERVQIYLSFSQE